MSLNHAEIYQLFNLFTDSGIASPLERLAAYQLAYLVPDLMIENARLCERLKIYESSPNTKVKILTSKW